MIRRDFLVMVSLLALYAAISSAAVAQDIQDRTIRFGHTVSPGHPIALGAKRFGEIVTAKSGGKIKFRDFPSSQLGPEAQQQSALVGGTQQMMAQGSAQLAGAVKEFGLLDFLSLSPRSSRLTHCTTVLPGALCWTCFQPRG